MAQIVLICHGHLDCMKILGKITCKGIKNYMCHGIERSGIFLVSLAYMYFLIMSIVQSQ